MFAPLLEEIFELSLLQEYFPMQWKKAITVRILKKGNSSFVGNYTPISLLNNFSKVLFCIATRRITFPVNLTLTNMVLLKRNQPQRIW
jgi:hypothetical protein